MEDSCSVNSAAQQAEAQRFRKQSKKIGRKLSRRLSLITKVPNIFTVKHAGNDSSIAPQKTVSLAATAAADSVVLTHEITVIAPDKTQRLVTGTSDQTIKQLLAGLVFEFSLEQPGYYLGGSFAELDENSSIAYVVGDIVIIQEDQFHSDQKHENDRRYCLTEKFVYDEKAFVTCLKSAKEQYGEPLRRMEIFSNEEYNLIFEKLLKVADECHQVIEELKLVMENWDPVNSQIGSLFNSNFWDRYNDYQDIHHHTKELLREKSALDEEFVAFCVQREGSAKNSLRQIIDLPVRIYLSSSSIWINLRKCCWYFSVFTQKKMFGNFSYKFGKSH